MGKIAPGEQLQNSSATKEAKPLGFLDPGAEYMSKFGRGEVKK
jgi:hypothetical protein